MECTTRSLILYFTVVFCVSSGCAELAIQRWQGDSVRWSNNCDFPGNDIGNQTIGGEHCGGICEFTLDKCTHFTFTLFQNGTCWFKSGPISPSQAIRFERAGAVCGYLTISWVQENGLSWSQNCNFPGGDFENQLATAADCGPMCMDNPQCTHFHWTRPNIEGQGVCWMKTGETSRENAMVTPGSRGEICGIRDQNEPVVTVSSPTHAPWFENDTCQCVC